MKESRGVGRPPVADKAIPRSIKVNDREWQEIKDNAKRANKTVARFLIDLGTKGCKKMKLAVTHIEHRSTGRKVEVIATVSNWQDAWNAIYADDMKRHANSSMIGFYDKEAWQDVIADDEWEDEEDRKGFAKMFDMNNFHGVWSDGEGTTYIEEPAEYTKETVSELLKLALGYDIKEVEQ